MKPLEFSITRELTPGTAITIKLTQEEIRQIFSTKDDAYMLEDAITHIDKLIASVTDNGNNPGAFQKRYGFLPSVVRGNESFARACVDAFKYEIEDENNHDAAWARVINEQLSTIAY